MEFTIYRKVDGYPVTLNDFNEAQKKGLIDLGEFMISENGMLLLSDNYGNYFPIQKEGKYIIDICIETQGTIVKIVY